MQAEPSTGSIVGRSARRGQRPISDRPIGVDRPGVEVALRHLAPEGPQALGLRRGLDALGDEVVAQRCRAMPMMAATTDESRSETPRPGDERLVDLHHVDRKPAQVGERRVAGAEVVEAEADTGQLQLAAATRRRDRRRRAARSR